MKLLASILSIYFLGLASIPCSDGKVVPECENQIHQVETGHENENPGDSCAPFCSCQCCQSQLTIIDFPVFEPLNPELQVNPISYKFNLGKEFSSPLFQPPRA